MAVKRLTITEHTSETIFIQIWENGDSMDAQRHIVAVAAYITNDKGEVLLVKTH